MILRNIFASLAALVVFVAQVYGDDCQEIMNNSYCSSVKALSYSNFGAAGKFDVVTNMVAKQGGCSKDEKQSFEGGVSPMDEGISWHFRGPINLKQFAAYTLPSKASKRTLKSGFQERRHGHYQYHKQGQVYGGMQNAPANRKRDGCGMVTATIDGKVASWTNNYMCTPTAAASRQAENATEINGSGGGGGKTVTITITVSAVSTRTQTTTLTPPSGSSSTSQTITSISTTLSSTSTSLNTVTVTSSSDTQSSTTSSESISTTLSSTSTSLNTVTVTGSLDSQTSCSSSLSASTTLFSTSTSLDTVTVSNPASSQPSSSSSQTTTIAQSASLSLSSTISSSLSTANAFSQSLSSSQTSSEAVSPIIPGHSGLPGPGPGSGNWARQAYYNAEQQVADGLIFLSHNGGDNGSGVFDTTYGASMAYAAPDAKSAASSPQTLANQMIEDGVEFIIVTEQDCDESCGYVRPGNVAHKGFEGSMRLFVMEFNMPLTGIRKPGYQCGPDCPAIWTLNNRIPLTQQYGGCSCWPGCGELDIFECLDSGNTRLKATFHGNNSGGDSDYFERPTDGTMKGAVIFDSQANTAHILVLDDNVDFGTSISSDTVNDWVSSRQDDSKTFANFKLVAPGG